MSARSRRRPLSSRMRTIACPPTTRPTASTARPFAVVRLNAKPSASLRKASTACSSRSEGSGASQLPKARTRCCSPSTSSDVSPAICGLSSPARQETTTCGSNDSSASLRSLLACSVWISERRRSSFSPARVRVRISRMAATTEKPRMASAERKRGNFLPVEAERPYQARDRDRSRPARRRADDRGQGSGLQLQACDDRG